MVNLIIGLFVGGAIGAVSIGLFASRKVTARDAEIDVLLLRCNRYETEYRQLVKDTSVKV